MIIKLSKYFLLFSLLIVNLSYAQRTSTYTRYGLGDVFYSYSARTLSMGHAGTAMINSDYVELLNPASWSNLKRTRIEFSFAYDELKLSNPSQTKYYGDGIFKGFTFAFPVSEDNGVGVAMGIAPYTRINYEVVDNVEDQTSGNYTTTYKGQGGLSRIFIGTTYRIPLDFTLGATLEYYFGNIKYTSSVDFDNSSYVSAEYERTFGPTGFGTTLGLITPDMSGLLNMESISNLRLGLSSNIISKLENDTSFISTSLSVVDTLGFGQGKLEVPMRINAGLHVTFVNVYNFALDYFFQPWTDLKFSGVNQQNLSDVHKVSLGFEYRPQREPGMSFWEQIMLRGGLSYEMSQYKFNSNELKQYSVFTGFALPLSDQNTLDFGFEYSIRGTTEDNLLEENFLRINLGISFGDLWFVRYEK